MSTSKTIEATPEATPFEFSAPVLLNPDFKRTIRDLKLFARLPMVEKDQALAAEVIPDVIDLLERAVVGGVESRPLEEFWPLIAEMTRLFNAIGNPKN